MTNTRTRLSAPLATVFTAVLVAACGVGEYDPEYEDLAVDDDQALSTTTLFGDAYATGWSPSWSWNSSVGTSSLAQSGTKSIAWTPGGAWAGLYLHSNTGVHTKGFSDITLAIRAPKSGMKIA